MDDLPERVSTADLLLAVLVALFGQKTVCVKMWRGHGNADQNVPVGYFATNRLGKRSDAPVNRLCAERVMDMATIALRGESGYDRCATSTSDAHTTLSTDMHARVNGRQAPPRLPRCRKRLRVASFALVVAPMPVKA